MKYTANSRLSGKQPSAFSQKVSKVSALSYYVQLSKATCIIFQGRRHS